MESNSGLLQRLVKWLLDNGYAEERTGYGHVSADELAEALLETFHIEFKEGVL